MELTTNQSVLYARSMTNNESIKVSHKMDPKGSHIARKYRKNVTVLARPAIPGEVIETRINDRLETRKKAGNDEMLITNPGGETYIVPGPTFRSKYALLEDNSSEGEWQTFQAKGEIWAVQNPFGSSIEIQAPWGEPMYGDESCWLVVNAEGDAYLLDDTAKNETYVLVEDGEPVHISTMVL